ncbi:MAG: coproporphyrinogen dehydrogenase HemZ [Firmicutes bacterium]|nr:coproporphyrinogen dehydrogenase HemZ [Bacillota bacterium]
MDYILKGHEMSDDVVSVLMLFFQNEKYVRVEEAGEGLTLLSYLDEKGAGARLYENKKEVAFFYCEKSPTPFLEEKREIKRVIGFSASMALKKYKSLPLPWGILTGVRPAKIFTEFYESGMAEEDIRTLLKEKYLVEDYKLSLMEEVSKNERQILKKGEGKVGIYIGIPFCPTRCLYCSFTSYPLSQYGKKKGAYLDALEKEIVFSSKYIRDKNIESIYIGGGTPTSLDEEELERLLYLVEKYFPSPEEYTVEAGRPDTLNREKLKILKKYNVGRISVNPQTLNQKTLDTIGRKHTVEDFISAFYMAREEGHEHINTDIILGLPGEKEKEVENTFKGLEKLSPESITVHTLAVKRASRLKEQLDSFELEDYRTMDRLVNYARECTEKMGMFPYYMYRQKNMLGNFENVGYCKENAACVYNVEIMEEKQSILALGAGASTKLVNRATNEIERIFNVKSVDDYISRIDEMIKRKEEGIKWL